MVSRYIAYIYRLLLVKNAENKNQCTTTWAPKAKHKLRNTNVIFVGYTIYKKKTTDRLKRQ